MMKFFNGLFMSLSMFSIIPVPKNIWNDKYINLILLCFPFVGLIIGFLWCLFSTFLITQSISVMIKSVFIMLMPFFLSGFIHIDGLMDTSDAVFSRRDLEERIRILKDSNVGAFAVISFVSLLLMQFSSIYTIILENKNIISFILIPILSRSISVVALLHLKSISDKGYGATFKKNVNFLHSLIIFSIIIFILILSFLFLSKEVFLSNVIIIISGIFLINYLYKSFNGISGDLCGCIISVCEMIGLLSIAIL